MAYEPLTSLSSDGYDSWRVRSLDEQQMDAFDHEFRTHTKALKVVHECFCRGDVENSAQGLKQVQLRLDKLAHKLAKASGSTLESRGISSRAQGILDEMIDEARADTRESTLRPLLALRAELFG